MQVPVQTCAEQSGIILDEKNLCKKTCHTCKFLAQVSWECVSGISQLHNWLTGDWDRLMSNMGH